MRTPWHYVPDFTEYGNRPKAIAMAFNTRLEIEFRRDGKRKSMQRTRAVDGVVRANGRVDVCEPDAWHQENLSRIGRSWLGAAPRSPADRWLLGHGYQKFPF